MAKRVSKYSKRAKKKIRGSKTRNKELIKFAGVLVGGLALVFTVYSLGQYILCQSSFFQIESIEVVGSEKLSAERVIELAGLHNRTNLAAINPEKVEKALQVTGWVKSVKVEKNWPNDLKVTIKERKAEAIIKMPGGKLSYVDRDGLAFVELSGEDDLDYPVISFTDADIIKDPVFMNDFLDFLRYASRGNSGLPRQNISQIVIDGEKNVTMYLADNPFPVKLGKGKMWQKYKRLCRVLSWLYKKRKFSKVAYINMEYLEGRVLVKFINT